MIRFRLLSAMIVAIANVGSTAGRAQSVQPLTETQRQTFERSATELQAALDQHPGRSLPGWADAAIFAKGLAWALRYDREFTPGDIRLLEKAIRRGRERLAAPTNEASSAMTRSGKLALGYLSSVDNSVQPYGLIVPRHYDSSQAMRLDVVLHGSMRIVGMAELRFIARFDDGEGEGAPPPDQPYIELHPLGRVENCYRWSGETDVFEAIEDVCRRYNIDRDRIVLRGMSMGASGTWHLGLKHPDRFVALGPYCGYVDTHRFSETPNERFVKIGPLPDHQELGLHLLDSQDYAANAGIVPAIACMGEKDIYFQAHVLMGEAMRREGLTMINLISPGTGHVIDPVTHAEQLRRIGEYVAAAPRRPRELRFVTWTLKYNRCHWLELLQLERHYARAEISARLANGVLVVDEPRNITRFAIVSAQLPSTPTTLRIAGADLEFPRHAPATDGRIILARRADQWRIEPATAGVRPNGKRPGLQGPIDDAFTAPFLCVRGTGQPWNAAVQAYADASLRRFASEWHHYFRGELPIKDDVDVTPADVQGRNLILFGDPGSNSWIAKVLPHLPLTWSKESLRLGDRRLASSEHLPTLIAPNPLPGAGEHYVVLNSGHTFRESELAKLNYLLFPRWGDWAILKIDSARSATEPLEDHVLQAGYFDEQWQLPVAPRNPRDPKRN